MNPASELDQLAADLRGSGLRVALAARAVITKTAANIRDDARMFAPGARGGRAKHYPKAITYDVDVDGLGADIGPEARGQGNLGHIFEYGTARARPVAHLGPALDRHEPDFHDQMTAEAAGSVW